MPDILWLAVHCDDMVIFSFLVILGIVTLAGPAPAASPIEIITYCSAFDGRVYRVLLVH